MPLPQYIILQILNMFPRYQTLSYLRAFELALPVKASPPTQAFLHSHSLPMDGPLLILLSVLQCSFQRKSVLDLLV